MPSTRLILGSRLRLLVLAALLAAGCRESSAPDPEGRARTVVVQPSSWGDPTTRVGLMTLSLGDSSRLSARAFDAAGARLDEALAAWSSSDPAVAEVHDGLVIGHRAGRAVIRAAVGSSADSVMLTILGPAAKLVLDFAPHSSNHPFADTIRVERDFSAALAVVVLDVAGNRLPSLQVDSALRWRSLDTTRATVEARSGGFAHLAAVRLGRTRVVATAFGIADTAEVLVPVGSGLSLPLAIGESVSFQTIALGSSMACGLSTDAQLFCWGSGAIGTGGFRTDTASRPRAVAPHLRFSALAVGGAHSCALDPQGEAYCWGDLQFGQTGTVGLSPFRPTPVVGGLSFTRIGAGGRHSCAIDAAGALYCWGDDSNGALGIAARAPLDCQEWDAGQNRNVQIPCHLRPARVDAPTTFVQIAAGRAHSCARSDAGDVWCWGSGVAAATGRGSRVPVRVAGITGATSIAAGDAHSCAIVADSGAFCWGENGDGRLGDGSTESRATPSPVAGGHRFRQLAAGINSTCGVTLDGSVRCWGDNAVVWFGSSPGAPVGNLGTEQLERRLLSPTAVLDPVAAIDEVSVGLGFACARRGDGSVQCWGIADARLGTGGASRVVR